MFVHENFLWGGKLETTMRRGICKDVGRGATAEVEHRSLRTVPCLIDFLEVLERPVHKAAAATEYGQNGRTNKFHHLGGIMFVPLD